MDKKFLLRKSTGDQAIPSEADLLEAFKKGQCKAADFVFDFGAGKWLRVGDHPALASLFSEKPSQNPDRRVIYFLPPGGAVTMPQGPFSTKEIQSRAQLREICGNTWVFVEGDKEWRQVKNVKILHEMLPALPTDKPSPPAPDVPPPAPAAAVSLEGLLAGADVPPAAPPAAAPQKNEAAPVVEVPSLASIQLDLGSAPAAPTLGGAPAGATAADPGLKITLQPAPATSHGGEDSHVEREEITMAMDMMGLNLHSESVSAPPGPPKLSRPGLAPLPSVPAAPAAPSAKPARPSAAAEAAPELEISPDTPPPMKPAEKAKPKDADSFDGIVAEIPMDPIWLVKRVNSETISGPFRFLEVVKFLEEGKLTKNDKIARSGTKAFTKIQQQYEFNVKYSIESVMEKGQERQKILIRRRHPRVPYITGVQIVSKHGLLAGQCVNISAGGILMEVPKAEFNLGEIIEVKILPGLIAKSISCKSLIIGKIPKIPPGYALKFEDLKPEDKEAIEYYVQETLKREMSKKN